LTFLVTGSDLWRKGEIRVPKISSLGHVVGPADLFILPNVSRDRKKGKMEPILMLGAVSPDVLTNFAPLLIIFVIFYLLIFMPMKKKQKKVEQMITALKNGDRVVTSSGIYGVVAGIKDRTFIIKIADQVKIEVAKNAITGLQGPEDSIQQ
jgi:preprotein translocase subunit YajC